MPRRSVSTSRWRSSLLINTVVSLFAGLLPIPGGIGVTEAGLTYGLTAAGLSTETAFAIAIAYRFCQLLPAADLGLVLLPLARQATLPVGRAQPVPLGRSAEPDGSDFVAPRAVAGGADAVAVDDHVDEQPDGDDAEHHEAEVTAPAGVADRSGGVDELGGDAGAGGGQARRIRRAPRPARARGTAK